jgi:protocatechuate 3,4-dioxygenase beta subunit
MVNNWRPAHIHVSVFGASFSQRLITQLYFEGDPLIPLCPIVQTIPDPDAIQALIARLDMNASIPLDAIAYRFDIVLRGRRSTLFENRLEG